MIGGMGSGMPSMMSSRLWFERVPVVSVVAEDGLAPLGSRPHGFFEVLRREAYVELGVALVIHVRVKTSRIETRPQQLLGQFYADVAEADNPIGERIAGVEESLRLDDP